MLKPKYVRWRDWWLWVLLPREKKRSLDDTVQQASLLRPLLRNHPDVTEKIRSGESCSWTLSRKDAAEALESVERYLGHEYHE